MDGAPFDHSAGQNEGGKQRVRNMRRTAVDYTANIAQWTRNRRPLHQSDRGFDRERPTSAYALNTLPPLSSRSKPADVIPARLLHSSWNKIRHPVNVVKWTPDGRRLLTGSTSGEFTLWNGISWNFETIMQAHDSAVRAVAWSHNDEWLISAEQTGVVKYWQPNFNNVKSIQAHDEPVRDLAFAPTDAKFVTAADDASLKIFDFAAGEVESVLTGHQWDAKCVDWHPTKGLLVSGSKDHQVKLWDPRTGRCLTTLHGHKNTISKTLFDPTSGNLLASCARDSTARIFDLRMMRDVFLLRGHEKDISTVIWHPFYPSLITTGGADGAMHHYLLDEQNLPEGTAATTSPYNTPDGVDASAQTIYPAHKLVAAHDFAIWSMDWHPLGHILASGSNDRATRFWTRPTPGDNSWVNDKWHIGQAAAEAQGTWKGTGTKAERRVDGEDYDEDQEAEDEAEALVDQVLPGKSIALPGLLPGLSGLVPASNLTGSGDGTSIGGVQTLSIPEIASLTASGNFPGLPLSQMQPPFAIPPPPNAYSGLPGQFTGGFPPPPLPPGMDVEKLKAMFGGNLPVPPPGMIPPGLPPQFMPHPAGFPPRIDGFPGLQQGQGMGSVESSTRRAGPLPSQQESLQEQLRLGNYARGR